MDHITRIQSKAWRDRSFSHFDMSDLLSCSQKLRSCLLVDTGIDTVSDPGISAYRINHCIYLHVGDVIADYFKRHMISAY